MSDNNQGLLGLTKSVNCTIQNNDGPKIIPLYGNTTFHTFAKKFSGGFAAIATAVCVVLILLHALHYSKPLEQRQIIRAISMVSIFAILSWATTFLTIHDAQYVVILQDLYESYAFASFFLLVVAWLRHTLERVKPPVPSPEQPTLPEVVVDDITQSEMASRLGIRWTFIFQFPFVVTILMVITEATNAAGRYCVSSHNIRFAHLWVSVFKGLSTLVAFVTLLRIVQRSKQDLAPFNPTRKLVAFKSIIALRFIQNFIFNFLLNGGHISPTKYLSYTDIAVSIPAMILCLEMFLFSLLFVFTFGIGPYLLKNIKAEAGASEYQGGLLGLRALFQAVNILDLFEGMFNGVAAMLSG